MKKIITSTVLSFIVAMALAIPAKRNWITVTQSDGTTLKVCLTGNEHMHFYVTSDNVPLYKDAENRFCYLKIEDGKLVSSNILAHEAERRTAKSLQQLQISPTYLPMPRRNSRLETLTQ